MEVRALTTRQAKTRRIVERELLVMHTGTSAPVCQLRLMAARWCRMLCDTERIRVTRAGRFGGWLRDQAGSRQGQLPGTRNVVRRNWTIEIGPWFLAMCDLYAHSGVTPRFRSLCGNVSDRMTCRCPLRFAERALYQSNSRNRFVRNAPRELEPGVLYISMEYATAVHSCCCGCGERVVTPFTPTDDGVSSCVRPRISSANNTGAP